MKKRVIILISILLLILDNALMPFLAINGSYPKLLFIFALAYSIINGRKEAVFIGTFTGILQDIYFYNLFGINSLINLFLCLLAAIIGENIYREKRLIPVISSIFIYILKVFAIYIIFKLLGKTIDIKIGIYSALYSSVFMFFGYNYIFKLCNNEYEKINWRFK
ncbi:rod shape-determining protein MreD [Caproiciproducens sp. MSJ-32]|uniref:rod shape-determining protein MreD n=1 Tax=Caproiciproducens sp. MSJ-32 TaxID=2841527 RepID=UPI001C11C7B4|nr:rod shape-determining protein MreD [Caproiciproducens sp. MSJ-32]MBU5455923.1 rod shape-determining protein MreD [Caproiciproducens sp. MSJ-32]